MTVVTDDGVLMMGEQSEHYTNIGDALTSTDDG